VFEVVYFFVLHKNGRQNEKEINSK
jgi:hypothetical protein